MHHHAYRSGQWAILVGFEYRLPVGHHMMPAVEPRLCFLVVFPDGKTDAWVVYDEDAKYEFYSVEAGS